MAISLQPNVWHVKNSEGNYLSSAILSTTLPQEADALLQRIRNALNAEEIDANTFKEGFSDDLDSLVSDARGTLDQMLEDQEQLIEDIRSTAQAKADAQSAATAAAQSATAASGSATAAAGSASNASDSANAAGQSASAASQSATAASNSATAAAGSATAASNSATAAAGSASDARTVLNSVVAETQDILDSIPSDYSDLSDDVDQLKIDITKKANAAELKSATPGDIVTFESGAEGLGITKLVTTIEPVQDLHGYNNPWPGGGGKNKLEKIVAYAQTVNGVTFTPLQDGTVQVSGTSTSIATTVNFEFPLAAGTYTISCTATAGDGITGVQLNGNNVLRSGSPATFEHSGGNVSVRCRVSSGVTVNEVWRCQIESGSTATDWTPYSNECPISGQIGAEISRTGVNVWDEEWESGGINENTGINETDSTKIRSKNYIPVNPGMSVYLKTSNAATYLWFYDKDKTFISASYSAANNVVAIPDNCYFVKLRSGNNSNPATIYNNDISINYPATDTDYHPYTGNQVSVTFPSSAGTVYGATMTLNPDRTGTLVVDRAIFDLGTILNWNKSSGVFYANIASDAKYVKDSKAICSCYKTAPASRSWSTLSNGEFIIWPGLVGGPRVAIAIRDDSCSTSDELRATVNGETVTYLLATPQTYQLTESEISGILTTLYGTNNIWTDTGSITELTYYSDTQSTLNDIRSLITSIESTSTASKNYAIGDVLLYNNKLYVTTSVITTGATLTPGTNIIETTVIARLLDLETRLKSGTLDNADLHLGLYVDSDGDISQVDN